ncbi:MAG TPA: class I SAM-dependent methyltransferase [Candidatus Dormibacteraeota bacterium]|jgi:SAM-dependent methyltransferase|nr:class I SAM-dependent methyltransferase [Candidatus Dormibacteraeota bacterium]
MVDLPPTEERAPTPGSGARSLRNLAYGERYDPTAVDRFGVWLSARRMRDAAGGFAGRRVADIGCGYHATFARTLLDQVAAMTLLDVSIAPELKQHARVRAIEGQLPDALSGIDDGSLDVVVCNSVLEHLWSPYEAIAHMHRVTAPGGRVLLNVPNWRGKWFLELTAFRFGVTPADEMNDHKNYYDPRDLWPLLVRAGFRPQDISCFRHKFGLNTFAICRKPG